ncbi:glycosyltransferase family protein [Sunxiuqinia sp. A32]|uniref:glycosyltransferase family protein n=1 Tax=Sunxiuqinia sp. A32 TaxID=3461496 RepID=UPI0040455F8C
MKILYAIQGTGNGHLARATEIVPLLKKMADTDVLVSGIQGDINLPFQVDYQFYGLSFIFGKKGGVSISKTLLLAKPFRLIRDIIKLPVKKYDLIISDFEPVSSWACKLRKKKCIGMSHQIAVVHPKASKPQVKNRLGWFILQHYAPTNPNYGIHFQSLDEHNFTPVIRSSIREIEPTNNGHYTVYLPAYSDEEIFQELKTFNHIKWEIFSKHTKETYTKDNIHFHPVSLEKFTRSFTTCKGILCTAGFETPAEAIFMGKKLCVIPMKNQYEQQCNAAFLQKMGIMVLHELKNQSTAIRFWLGNPQKLEIDYPDNTADILEKIVFSA